MAVLVDATIVRAVLLPAAMKLLGDWNWPGWLAIVLGVVSVTPVGWFTAFALVVWTVVVAVLVYVRTAPLAAPAPTALS